MTDKTIKKKSDKRLSLADLMAKGGGLNVQHWPESCGDFDIKIDVHGQWYYRNSPIGRIKLCQLFATCLQRDDEGRFWLITPVEKGLVEVEDAPFVCVELEQGHDSRKGQWLRFRTSLDFWVEADDKHQIQVKLAADKTPRPYIHVRDGLWALITRSVFYQLIDCGKIVMDKDGFEWMVVESNGQIFDLSPIH
ncbi:MAG: DUF1285 domain-containing protein [Pseudomonadota bacterium]